MNRTLFAGVIATSLLASGLALAEDPHGAPAPHATPAPAADPHAAPAADPHAAPAADPHAAPAADPHAAPAADAHAAPAGEHGAAGDHAAAGDHGAAAHHGPHFTGDVDNDGTANWLDADADEAMGEGTYVLKTLGFHFFNFVIYGLLIWKFALPLLRDSLRERALGIQRSLAEAATLRAEAEARHAEVTRRLSALASEVATIQAHAEEDAKADEARLRQRADEASRRVAETAQRQIADEASRARRAIRAEAVEAAVQLAEGIVQNRIQGQDQQRLAAEFLAALKSEDAHV